jgi:hypothetical protein
MNEALIINSTDDLHCDICGLSLKGYEGPIAALAEPIDKDKPEGFRRYYKAIHLDCYTK